MKRNANDLKSKERFGGEERGGEGRGMGRGMERGMGRGRGRGRRGIIHQNLKCVDTLTLRVTCSPEGSLHA